MGGTILSFQQIIDEQSRSAGELNPLPFCHTTTEGYAISIIESKSLNPPEKCGVYQENLLYFFYGKPSFLVEKELANYTDNPPITFIYEVPEITKYNIKRMLPFDSGGFEKYQMRRGFSRNSFTHTAPTIDKIKGAIKLIYSNNESYLKDRVNLQNLVQFQDRCGEIKEIIAAYKNAAEGKLATGKQIYSIEIQYESIMRFEPKYIVLPYNFYTTQYWGTSFKMDFPTVLIEYYAKDEILDNDSQPLQASEYQRLMVKKVHEIVARDNQIDHE